jgi:cob(I)alamin adenosyltransferase
MNEKQRSQVTTKRGDAGETTTLSGEALPKCHPIMECTGAVDRLRAQTALLRLRLLERDATKHKESGDFLWWLLHCYFLIGTECSDPDGKLPDIRKTTLSNTHLQRLEEEQARLEATLNLPPKFIVSAANVVAAEADLTCVAVRELERALTALRQEKPNFPPEPTLAFVNRLSDYFFILARSLDKGNHQTVDYTTLD